MPTTSGNRQPPTGTSEAVCAAFEMMRKTPIQDSELLYYYERRIMESDMDKWPDGKAVVLVEQVDGTFIDLHEFDTNQEAADLMFTYFRKPVNITYKPIGASRECFGMESHESSVDNSLLLDILLDNL